MEFTENQQHPFKRMSRLGIVALLHVALLAALLNSMKIKISPPHSDPVIVEFDQPKAKPLEPEPKFKPDLPLPKDPPPYIPEVEVAVKNPVNDSPISKVNPVPDKGEKISDPGGNGDGPLLIATGPTKAPVHIAAVVDMSRCEKPVYPASSIRNTETGTVTLAMLIGADGRVLETKTEGSSGYRNLDKAASQALSLCRFTPGTIDGVAQQSWTKVQYVWKID
ncbi:MAG: TonB family protein [Burkholderiales bacterium]|nr:TonB family protein [Burkholderiales bacterium]